MKPLVKYTILFVVLSNAAHAQITAYDLHTKAYLNSKGSKITKGSDTIYIQDVVRLNTIKDAGTNNRFLFEYTGNAPENLSYKKLDDNGYLLDSFLVLNNSFSTKGLKKITIDGNIELIIGSGSRGLGTGSSDKINLPLSITQIPIYDALVFEKLSKCEQLKLFKSYINGNLSNTLASNHFLNKYADIESECTIEKNTPGFQGSSINVSSILSKAGNLDVTTFADGLAQFLLERAKAELSEMFFRKLQEDMKKYPDLKKTFPQTASFIALFESYELANLLPSLRQAFVNDIEALPGNILSLRDLSVSDCNGDGDCEKRTKAIQLFLTTPEALAVQSALIVSQSLVNGRNPLEVLEDLANDKIIMNATNGEVYQNSIKLAYTFSESIKSKSPQRVWVGGDTLQMLVKDVNAFNLFLGLVYERYKGNEISFKYKSGANDVEITFEEILKKFETIKLELPTIQAKANDLDKTIQRIKEAREAGRKPEYSDVSAAGKNTIYFVQSFLGLVSKLDTTPIVKTKLGSLNSHLNIWAQNINYSSQLVAAIQNKDYSLAVFNTAKIIDNLMGEFAIQAKIAEPHLSTDDKKALEKLKNYPTLKLVLKYGTFFAQIGEAKTSEDVKKVIEAFALPPGSSSIKQYSCFSAAIQAYIGPSYSFNTLSADYGQKHYFGAWAPVGVSASVGLKNNFVGSISVFASVLDVGAFAAYRFATPSSDTSFTTPKVTLENIFAPGGHLVFGRLFNTPLALAVGIQHGPNVWTLKNTSASNYQDLWKINFSLVFDIPLVNIYAKPRE